MPPTISVTIASQELGLSPGDVTQIDAAVRRFPREPLVLRIISVLNGLAALGKQAKNLSVDFAQILPADARQRLLTALSMDNALFLEPWQQLVVLRRTLETDPGETKTDLDFLTEEGERCYLDICRFASDALRASDIPSWCAPIGGCVRLESSTSSRVNFDSDSRTSTSQSLLTSQFSALKTSRS